MTGRFRGSAAPLPCSVLPVLAAASEVLRVADARGPLEAIAPCVTTVVAEHHRHGNPDRACSEDGHPAGRTFDPETMTDAFTRAAMQRFPRAAGGERRHPGAPLPAGAG